MNSLVTIITLGTSEEDKVFWKQLVKDTIKYSNKELTWKNLRMFFPRDNFDFELGRYMACQVTCSETRSKENIKQALRTAFVKNFRYISELTATFMSTPSNTEIIYDESKE